MKNSLAILIPAFKTRFYRETLNSIANQTCKNFTLFVGDDCSPYNIEEITLEYRNVINIKYVKFPNNIGAKHLVNQWNRCLNLVNDEEWIWLFSDDDIMDANCVDLFYKSLERNSEKLIFRFDVKIINDQNEYLGYYIKSPEIDTYDSFISGLMQLKRGNGIIDTIYNKKILKKAGGYKFTYYAQSADWTTLINCLKFSDVLTIPSCYVNWRKGEHNISGNANRNNYFKVKGYTDFLRWLVNDLNSQSKMSEELISNIYLNFSVIIKMHYGKLSFLNIIDVIKVNHSLTKNPFKIFNRVIRLYLSH